MKNTQKIQLILYVAVILLPNIISSQSANYYVKVQYNYNLKMGGAGTEYAVKSILTFNNKESVYEIDHTHSLDNEKSVFYGDNTIYKIKSNSNDFVYKNYEEKTLYYKERIGFKKFYIKDSLNTIDWNLTANKKEILGYKCQEATAAYKGRNYIAYFTNEISGSNGPWRFNGLPGLILEIYDVDNVFKISATDIVIKKEKIEIENPYKDEKLLSWNEFLKLYKIKYDQTLRNGMTEYGPSAELAKKSIVEYIKE